MSSRSPRLSSKRLHIHGSHSIRLDDLLAARLLADNDSATREIRLVSFPLVKGRRERREDVLRLPSLEAMNLHSRLQEKLRCRPHEGHAFETIIPPPIAHAPRSAGRRILVIVNPFSGQQLAPKLWKEEAAAILEDAEWQCDIVETARPGHAIEIAKELDLDHYNAVLINSGDGLISEFLHGLLLRRDRERALLLPLGHLPGGTSNALAASICYACNEPFSARFGFMRESAIMAARPHYLPLRILRADVEGSGSLPLFMSLTYGLIADIDIESERFRWIGMIRLHVEAIIRIFSLPTTSKYPTRVSYIPAENSKEMNRKTMLRYNADRALFGKGHFDLPPVEEFDSSRTAATGQFESINDALDFPTTSTGSLLPPLDKPIVDDRFTVIEGDYVFVCLTSTSHLGSDLPYIPSAKLEDDGIFWLTLIDWRILKHRMEIMALMSTIDGSRHLAYPCFQCIPVRACRVEPLSLGGNVAVDGEPRGKGKAFQAEALPLKATVIGRTEVSKHY